jgi:hypothetical protein
MRVTRLTSRKANEDRYVSEGLSILNEDYIPSERDSSDEEFRFAPSRRDSRKKPVRETQKRRGAAKEKAPLSRASDPAFTSISTDDDISFRFDFEDVFWQADYSRNNKHSDGKNLRCFPTCKKSGHVVAGFCGRPMRGAFTFPM